MTRSSARKAKAKEAASKESASSPSEDKAAPKADDKAATTSTAVVNDSSTAASVTDSKGTASPKTSPSMARYAHPPPVPPHPHHHYYPYPPPPPYDPAAYAAAAAAAPETANGTTNSAGSPHAAGGGTPGSNKSSKDETGSPGSKTGGSATPSAGSPTAAARNIFPPHPPPHYMAHYPYPPPPPHHHEAAAAYHRWAQAAAASGYPPPPHHHHPAYPPPPPPHYDHYAAAAHATALAAKSPGKPGAPAAEQSPHGSPTAAPGSTPGPYRFSDTSLRRDALARLGTPAKNATSSPGSSPAKDGIDGSAVANGSPQQAVASPYVMEMEARAERATSPSQIEDFHREEVTSMGCTCKKTKCLKLYCQCFGVKIYCGHNCRCLSCHNLPQYDMERETAIRIILTRNPNAFETKFQKNGNMLMAAHRAAIQQPSSLPMPARVLSHKLGCKCRKSACMKKYCECYAGNVKCSNQCRCVGCKNQPLEGFEDKPPPPPMAVKKDAAWQEAAYSLAFLKHGTPEKPARTNSGDKSEAGSMPSLASEESPTGARAAQRPATGVAAMPPPSTSERAAVNALQSSEKTAVNALLMAARAMVGGGSGAQGNTRRGLQSSDALESLSAAATAPVKNGNGDVGTPDTSFVADEQFETPQRNLMKNFTSPKRKAGEAHDTKTGSTAGANGGVADDSPKRDHPGNTTTPSVELKVKRSRIGSVRKGPLAKNGENGNVTGEAAVDAASAPMEMSTPAKGTTTATADLTPVSARCIDFKKMHVTQI